MIGTLLGGIGLFLLGMILMTDGLKAAAGDARNLDPSVAELPPVAIEAARRSVVGIAAAEIDVACTLIDPGEGDPRTPSLDSIATALHETREFLRKVRTAPTLATEHARHQGVLHALDHLDRLDESLREPPPRADVGGDDGTRVLRGSVRAMLHEVARWLRDDGASPLPRLEAMSREVAEYRRARRAHVLSLAASGEIDAAEALRWLEGLRWLDRVLYHVWRSVHHLAAPGEEVVDVVGEAHVESAS